MLNVAILLLLLLLLLHAVQKNVRSLSTQALLILERASLTSFSSFRLVLRSEQGDVSSSSSKVIHKGEKSYEAANLSLPPVCSSGDVRGVKERMMMSHRFLYCIVRKTGMVKREREREISKKRAKRSFFIASSLLMSSCLL